MSPDSFAKSQNAITVFDLDRNLVPDFWTAGGEGALSELGLCPHDNSCIECH